MGGGNDNFVYLSANYKETDGHEGYVMFEQQGVNETILSDMEEQNLVSSVMSISNTSEGNESEKGKEKDEFNKDWEDRSESPYSLSEPELEKSYLFVKTQLKGKGTEHKEFDYSFPNDNFPEEDIPSECKNISSFIFFKMKNQKSKKKNKQTNLFFSLIFSAPINS